MTRLEQIAVKHANSYATHGGILDDVIEDALRELREEMAKVCEHHTDDPKRHDRTRDPYITTLQCAAAIRRYGEEEADV